MGGSGYDTLITNVYICILIQLKFEPLQPFLCYRVWWPKLPGGGCTCISAQITREKQRDAGHLNKAPGQVILWLMLFT